jgi:hypothetical protein
VNLYQNRLLTEGIRIIEKLSPSESFNADYSSLSFDDALSKRTQLAELRFQVSPVFQHFQRLLKLFCGLFCLLFLMIGASSVSQFLVSESGAQINFFWGIVLFIAPNILSLCLWLFFYVKRGALNNSWLMNISLSGVALLDKLQHKIHSKNPHYIPLFHFYFEHRFGSYMGREQLSLLSHLWWSCYLLGATVSLLVVLATHQVDFIWQTTILNEAFFVQLTQLLTAFPHMLGINVPTPSDVGYASISLTNPLTLAQTSRISWSNLMIFSLIAYALLPRILLALFFQFKIKNKKKQFKLNLALPYYLALKNILHPMVKQHFISDPDTEGAMHNVISDKQHQNRGYNNQLVLPTEVYPLAIELNRIRFQQASNHASSCSERPLMNILDNQTQQQALSALISSDLHHIVLYVDVLRLPDRGWLSLVKQLRYKNNVQVYLLLLGEHTVSEDMRTMARLDDWLSLATQAQISQQQINYLVSNGNHEASNG